MECPGCGAYSSSVLIKARNDEPCPFCGLSASAIYEILAVRRKTADKDLKEQLEIALTELDRAQAEAARLRSVIADVRDALGGTPLTPFQ
jgi:hypothetical protein